MELGRKSLELHEAARANHRQAQTVNSTSCALLGFSGKRDALHNFANSDGFRAASLCQLKGLPREFVQLATNR